MMRTLPADDLSLAMKLEREILQDPRAGAARIGVSVANGIAYLRGEVRSSADALDLTQAAGRIEGIGAVEDELRLEGEQAVNEVL